MQTQGLIIFPEENPAFLSKIITMTLSRKRLGVLTTIRNSILRQILDPLPGKEFERMVMERHYRNILVYMLPTIVI